VTNNQLALAKTRQIIWAKAMNIANFYPLAKVNGNEK
jgi:hypothetical protein